jgi:hypothetical protein
VAVELVSDDIVHMDKLTFMWVQLTHFSFDIADEDREVLEQLVENDAYAHDYASPFPSHPQPLDTRIHGRWNLCAIAADRFQPIAPDAAIELLEQWANDQEWTDPGYSQPPEVMERLEPVHRLLRSGTVLQLDNPNDESMHEYGFVTGGMGFHEFVVIDRNTGSLHVIVASDD